MITAADLAAALGRPAPTAEQAAVIEAPLEPALVVAGAGSGKTETIAARVVYLVANGLIAPDQVLGLTFTRKAAAELSARIRTRLHTLAGSGQLADATATVTDGGEPTIGTYHSFAGQVINEFGPLAGIEPTSRVLTATGCWQLARDLVGRWDRDLDTDHQPETVTEELLALASTLADHLVEPDALDAELSDLLETIMSAPPAPNQRKTTHSGLASVVAGLTNRRALIPLVRAYTAAKREINAVDFADQMRLAAHLVRNAPQVGAALRDRHPVVLLDEYQDTGHAQRVILRGLFGVGDQGPVWEPADDDARPAPEPHPPWRGHCVTAVGDPVQSIYEWRGASASNLPRFVTDFPRRDGTAAPMRLRLVSFRNSTSILRVANVVSGPARRYPVPVGELAPRADADTGTVTAALLPTIVDEQQWLAGRLAAIWRGRADPPSTAVLVRRRADMAGLAQALRAAGLPVEVVGVGGLVDEPDVADVIAMMRMVVDHQSGPAAVRILTGARWRLGLADLAALSRRSASLQPPAGGASTGARVAAATPEERLRHALAEATGGEDVDTARLVDALADPGNERDFSPAGWQRIRALGAELRALRARMPLPLDDLVADIERSLGLPTEALLTDDGRAHLDAFASVVADVAATGAGPVELLDYLATAAQREDGLTPGAVPAPTAGRVQVLTVHAAKGLEWDVVAVPHLCSDVFPGHHADVWLTDAAQLPPSLRGDREDLPALTFPTGVDQGGLAAAIRDHRDRWKSRKVTEERRLFYVAVTRARHDLLLSAFHWSAGRKRPYGPSEFLLELLDGEGAGLAAPSPWSPPPASGAVNPLTDDPVTAVWPVDPLGDARDAVQAAATRVLAAVGRGDPEPAAAEANDPEGWMREAEQLLAERDRSRPTGVVDVPLPPSLSVTALVEMAGDAELLARRLRRPVPQPPAPQARRGTAFHAWVERHFGAEALLDVDELPGAHDRDAAPDDRLADLVDAFRRSPWAQRTPVAVEVPFVTDIADVTVRGRMDAVFADPDGGATVIDWKTGAVPTGQRARAAAVQLTVYRLAWARLHGLPLEKVRAAFYYVGADRTVTPADLMDADALAEMIEHATAVATVG